MWQGETSRKTPKTLHLSLCYHGMVLVFIDESGDQGRKIQSGSSLYFVVALVSFDDDREALACDNRIDQLRQELGRPPNFEFHFAKNSKKIREQFLRAVTPFAFSYHVFALNKDPGKLYGPGFDVKESMYKFTARLTLQNAEPYLKNARVVIDKNGDRRFRDELAAYLRTRVRDSEGGRLIRGIKLQRSDGNNLLQLADYVASISNRVVLRKQDGIDLRKRYLAPHQLTFQTWPK